MSFTFSLASALVLVSSGGACGCLLCILCGKLFHKRVLKNRFTIFCLLLSLAIAVVAFLLIFSPALFETLPAVAKSNRVFLAGLFFLGLLSSCFWKVVLPLVVSCYIFLSIFAGVKLYTAFGAKEDTLSVSVRSEDIKVNEMAFLVANPRHKSIVLRTYTLPAELLLPLPRVWYTVAGVAESQDSAKNIATISDLHNFSGIAESPVVFSGEEGNSFLHRGIASFRTWLLAKKTYQLVPLPDSAVLPSLYTIKIEPKGDRLHFSVTRNL